LFEGILFGDYLLALALISVTKELTLGEIGCLRQGEEGEALKFEVVPVASQDNSSKTTCVFNKSINNEEGRKKKKEASREVRA
jgi:hypothetical protein